MSPTGNVVRVTRNCPEDDTLDYEILSWHKTFVNNLRRGILIAIIRGNEFQIIPLIVL